MKYIITESRLNEIIFNYLDNENFYLSEIPKRAILTIKQNNNLVMYHSLNSEELFVSYYLYNSIMSLFGLTDWEIVHIFKEWVKSRFNIEVNAVHVAETF